jgi:hypothetical protein
MDFTKNKQNLIWLGIAAVAAAFFLYSGKINLPNQQQSQSPQHQTPGSINLDW